MPPPPGPSVGQQELARSIIKMLKLYRSEKSVTARRQIAYSIKECAGQLFTLPDAGGIPARGGGYRWNWPAPRPGTDEPPHTNPPAPPQGRVVREGHIPPAPEPPRRRSGVTSGTCAGCDRPFDDIPRCLWNCTACDARCIAPALEHSNYCGRHRPGIVTP